MTKSLERTWNESSLLSTQPLHRSPLKISGVLYQTKKTDGALSWIIARSKNRNKSRQFFLRRRLFYFAKIPILSILILHESQAFECDRIIGHNPGEITPGTSKKYSYIPVPTSCTEAIWGMRRFFSLLMLNAGLSNSSMRCHRFFTARMCVHWNMR